MDFDTNNLPMHDEIPGWENTSQEVRQVLTGCSRLSQSCPQFVGMSDDDEPMAVYRGVSL